MFLLPWHGHTLVGTTDAPSELTYFPRPKESDIQFILDVRLTFFSKNFEN